MAEARGAEVARGGSADIGGVVLVKWSVRKTTTHITTISMAANGVLNLASVPGAPGAR